MAVEVAGTVTIQIGGNIAPFEQALAKAQQLAATFDAQITQKLSGAGLSEALTKIAAGVDQTNALLAKMAGSGTQAGAAMAQVSASAKNATSAVAQLSSASVTANAEIGKIGGGGAAAGLGAATVSAKEFAAALQVAGGNLAKVNVGLEEQSQEVKAVADALRGYSQAQVDAFKSQQEGAEFNRDLTERVGILDTATKSARDSAAAFQAFGLTETEVALGARGVSSGINEGATAAKLGAGQMMALSHSARSAAESLALGVSPMQALMMQANHLSFALTGPQGVIAATAGARAAFMSFLTSATGIVTTAGVAAVAGLAAYIIETRNSIKSVDEVLSEHKALIDEIAAAYPEAAKAAASYAEAAKRIPKSVATADIVEQAKENKKTLDDTMGYLSTRLKGLSEEWGLVGTAGTKAFSELAQIANSGAVDAADRIESALGKMRIDPALNENAHEFARLLQADATAAAKLQDALNEKNTVKGIVADGNRATQTLHDIAGGFKNIGSSAGGADATIAKLFGTLNSGSDQRFGVSRGFGLDSIINQTQQAGAAIQQMRQEQVESMLELNQQFRDTTQKVGDLKQAIATAAGKENIADYFGDVSNIANANSELQNATETVNKLFNALNSGGATANTVAAGIEMIRQQLIQDGFGTVEVEKFIHDLVAMRMQMDAGVNKAAQLNSAIQAIKNRTVTITVVTQQVGTGTKSIYDVPGGTVGVTRYGGQSDMTQQSYSVPSSNGGGETSGSGSSYGVSGGTSGVTVTRFGGTRAAGGPIEALMPYWVGEHGPELVVPSGAGTVIPNSQSTALANPQSGFTGTQPTQDIDRIPTTLLNTEANTRKTAQLLDDIKTSTAASSSALSSGSSGGSSSGGGGISTGGGSDPALYQQYLAALAIARSNFKAAGIVGKGIIGYGLDRLAASPEQIAHRQVYGFAPGGMIGGDAGDTQKVEFFKNPNERVIIARPDQFTDARSAANSNASSGDRPINVTINQTHSWNGNAPPSQDSVAEMRRQTALAVQDAMRSYRGR